MKRFIYPPLVYSSLVAAFFFSCYKPAGFFDALRVSTYLTLVESSTLVSGADPGSAIRITVKATGSPVASVNLYVAAAATTDSTQWKFIKNVPFKDSATVSTTNADIATALGLTPGQLPAGATYTLYNQVVTNDGRHYSSANTNASDLENQLAYNAAMKWTATVVCAYDASAIGGTYAVVQDDWQDWQPGDSVVVTAGAGLNEVDLSQVWPNPAFASVVTPFVLKVDPATGVVTVPALVFGDYGNYKASSVSGSGFIFSCRNRIAIAVHIDAGAAGDAGNNQLILQK